MAGRPGACVASEAGGALRPPEGGRDFRDPARDGRVDPALASNLDVVEAVARVERARAQSGIAWADLFPQIQAGGDVSRTSQPANTGIGGALGGLSGDSARAGPVFDRFAFTTYSASLGFSWELDFWGRARNDGRAAVADVETHLDRYPTRPRTCRRWTVAWDHRGATGGPVLTGRVPRLGGGSWWEENRQ